jgi:hypothetical protein
LIPNKSQTNNNDTQFIWNKIGFTLFQPCFHLYTSVILSGCKLQTYV